MQLKVSSWNRWTIVVLASMLVPTSAIAQRLVSRFTPPHRERAALYLFPVDEPEVKGPSGKQIVVGYMGAVLIGFLAWRAFDEPAGQHVKVKDDWGYTPDANTALGIGSYVGATLAVWGSGHASGAKGTLLGTAIGAAVPTIPILMRRDDPLLPFVAAIFGAPMQGIFGYIGYKATAKQ